MIQLEWNGMREWKVFHRLVVGGSKKDIRMDKGVGPVCP